MSEPSAPAYYLFLALQAAIDQAVAERDPGVAVLASDRFMTPATPINLPYQRHFRYSYEDGISAVSFTYSMRNRSMPFREEEDEHAFLLQLTVDGIERDKHYRLFHGEA